MKLSSITINHMIEPLGFEYKSLRVDFKVEAEQFENIDKQLTLSIDGQVVYQTDWLPFGSNYFVVDYTLTARTRYDVTVSVKSAKETVSKDTFFETGKMSEPFTAKWIANSKVI